ncbi:MlaA family lipoprotein [Thiohalophilus thiocyanatoxydans]|uniref:Phospholipid-binding lipoprotein MlaA n=1 Tax=Thiohalophilus thiocyanatoxydans TaxID=381308 RepID=A0A4R8ILT4_9GAMM|nr:VacJ family lipoprotein [Thiohalophilus thiocyanatoxydans]TDY01094.1 phospholipid-binding lipoprotein MlaA [Thiohalophilus thiocyanatoxydans]
MMKNNRSRALLPVALLAATLLISGCASTNGPTDEGQNDPLESYNRVMYQFNDAVDRSIARPVAQAYKDNVPQPAQTGVSNFFSNLDDVWVMVNNVLQFKFRDASSDFSRVIWNSTVGLFGLIDVATPMGLPKHNEDFGQTLGRWGVGEGPYIVLPLLGPSTLRDTGGRVADWHYEPLQEIEDDEVYWSVVVLRAIDNRADLLGASRMLEESGADPYTFMRDAYLQRRRSLVHDGNPPRPERERYEPSDEDRELERELERELQ